MWEGWVGGGPPAPAAVSVETRTGRSSLLVNTLVNTFVITSPPVLLEVTHGHDVSRERVSIPLCPIDILVETNPSPSTSRWKTEGVSVPELRGRGLEEKAEEEERAVSESCF